MDKSREIAIAFGLNLIAGILLFLATKNWYVALIATLLIASMVLTLVRILSFRNVGIISWSRKRGLSKGFRECLLTVSVSLDFLATWGGSIPSLSPNIEFTFLDHVRRGCRFRFLLLRP